MSRLRCPHSRPSSRAPTTWAGSFSNRGGLTGSASGSSTSNGALLKADLTLRKLAWQGNGLAATGTLGYQGTVTTEVGTAGCARVTTTFTLRPR